MGDKSKIAWTDATWNPIVGCAKVSEGCRNCYAQELHEKRHKAFQEGKLQNIPQYAQPFSKIQLLEDRLQQPLKWKRPRKIFVNSLSDLFHPDVPFEFIDKIFAVMAMCPQHTFQILTKRPERMLSYFNGTITEVDIQTEFDIMVAEFNDKEFNHYTNIGFELLTVGLPLKNVWLGVTAENQEQADKRIPLLLQVPAVVRFISVEPMLGPVELSKVPLFNFKDYYVEGILPDENEPDDFIYWAKKDAIKFVICGGESGPQARPLHPGNVRFLRDQCIAAGVKFFFKQWGEWRPSEFSVDQIVSMYNCIPGLPDNEMWIDKNGRELKEPNDTSWLMMKLGTKNSGCLLNSREWKELPEVAA